MIEKSYYLKLFNNALLSGKAKAGEIVLIKQTIDKFDGFESINDCYSEFLLVCNINARI